MNGRELERTDCMKKSVVAGEEIITSPTFLERPSDIHPEIKGLMTAQEAYEWIVDNGGASLPARDEVDAYLIDELPRIPIMTVCRTSLKINTALIRTIRQMP